MQRIKSDKTIQPHLSQLLKIIVIVLFIVGVVLAFSIVQRERSKIQVGYQTYPTFKYALIGDIGGTNIRYQLVSFYENQKQNYAVVKEQRMKVKDYDSFESTVHQFLSNVTQQNYPHVAVIAMAGPIHQNTVALSNVPKWGRVNGTQLISKLNISQFLFINDFEAISYGLLIADDQEFVKLNNKTLNGAKIRGVIGPGTGLGHSIILNNPQIEDEITVLPSQAGHSDCPYIDSETVEYIEFLKVKFRQNYIDVEKAFCGPTIPLMLEFYSKKFQITQNIENLTSQEIITNCMKKNPQFVYEKVYQLFMKLYSAAIGNFMIQHMTTGGVYLVGGLTKSMIQKIRQKDILEGWKLRHPEMISLIESMPIVFCNEIDLGLKGAFVISTRLISKRYFGNSNKMDESQTL